MKTFKELRTLWTVLFVALSSCTHYTVYDKEVCGDLGAAGAHCNHTLVERQRDMSKAKWDRERVGWLCTNSAGFNDTETVIEQFCVNNPQCDYATREAITGALTRMRGVARRAYRAKKLSEPRQKLDSPSSPESIEPVWPK